MVATLVTMLAMVLLSGTASATPASDAVRTLAISDPAPLVIPANVTAPVVFTVTLSGAALVTGEQVSVHLTRWGDYSSMNVSALTGAESNLTFVAGGPRTQTVPVLLHNGDSPALLDDPFFFDACLSKLRWSGLPT